MKLIRRLAVEAEGQDLVEYALLLCLVALVVAAAFPPISAAISGAFTRAAGCLNGAACAPAQ